MSILGPDGRALRSFGNFGTRRKLPIEKLEAGMMLCEHILGFKRKILVAEGEVLSQKHVDQLRKLCAREGVGCLLNYTREVWIKATLASGDERPKCETDPYAAHSIQKWYRKGDKLSAGPRRAKASAAVTTYKVEKGGSLREVKP